jgi:hypothetical protein
MLETVDFDARQENGGRAVMVTKEAARTTLENRFLRRRRRLMTLMTGELRRGIDRSETVSVHELSDAIVCRGRDIVGNGL